MGVENKNNPVFAQHECQILDLATNQKKIDVRTFNLFLSIFFKKKDTRILLKHVFIKYFF